MYMEKYSRLYSNRYRPINDVANGIARIGTIINHKKLEDYLQNFLVPKNLQNKKFLNCKFLRKIDFFPRIL